MRLWWVQYFLTYFFMRTINRVTLMGNLAADPEVRSTKTGKDVANFSIATNRGTYSKNSELPQTTDFHRVVAWDALARVAKQYLFKGMPVYVEGRLAQNSYVDEAGVKHQKAEITLERMHILSWKKNTEGQHEVSLQEMPVV